MARHRASTVRRAAVRSRALSLAKGLLDRVEVRAVGRQIAELGAGSLDRLAHALDLVRLEIVQHHDVALAQGRRQRLLDIGKEARAARIEEAIAPSKTQGAVRPS
jgi:hypothetical protein